MIAKKYSKMKLRGAVFGCFLAIMGLLGMTAPVFTGDSAAAVARETEVVEVEEAPVLLAVNEESVDGGEEMSDASGTGSGSVSSTTSRDGCKQSLGEVGWFTCSITKKISEAVDWLYGWLEKILVLNPVVMEDGSPVYEIWKYCLLVTNIVFIIFLLVVIYSQITGLGISNYGIKKALPKLIVTAVLVNLSFLICSLAVDLSNAIGNGLTGLFNSVGQAAAEDSTAGVSLGQAYGAIAGGGAVAIGAGVVAFEAGAIWMLIPVALGAIAAVAVGLFVLALRHAVVVLLIMVAPLAMVANILPNTEHLFKKWKQLFIKMMTFYPLFSLLFGASALAGYAIMMSAQTWFGVLLGIAVQIFPLFFSVSLMKMSGTFLSGIYSKVQGLASRPVASSRAWADSHRQLTRAKHLASGKAYMPSMKLMNYMSDRKVAREEELSEHAATVKNRGLAYNVARKYRNGVPNKEAEEDYAMQAKNMKYAQIIERHKNNMNAGLGVMAKGGKQKVRLEALDNANIKASDALKAEQARGEIISYRNAVGFHERMMDAQSWYSDEKHGYKIDKDGNRVKNDKYKFHFDGDPEKEAEARARYEATAKIMGNNDDVHYVVASAAHLRDTQQKIYNNKIQKYAELLPPTRDLEYRVKDLIDSVDKAGNSNAIKNIDAVISMLRVFNQRGDTDLVKMGLAGVLEHGVELGTHASQALAGFTMFEVKDNDPFIRRFGKYINLETAQVYNKNKRKNKIVTLKEYVTGQYEEEDPDNPGQMITRYSKRPMNVLMEGTSLDGIERTAMGTGDEIVMDAYKDENGKLDMKNYFRKRDQIETAIGPAFISASLKYMSGSEQLKSAVKYKTGYTQEMVKERDENGKEHIVTDKNGEPLYEWVAVWEKPEDDNPFFDDPEYAKKYYREHTIQYIMGQTPTQIFGLRTDYRDGLREHLADTFIAREESELNDEEREARREYEMERSRIQTKYGDAPMGEAKRERDAELKKAREQIAGFEMRKILDQNGTLEQIYRTRRSGAANGAKPWVRAWLGLDNEVMIRMYEAKKSEARKREREMIDQKVKESSQKMGGVGSHEEDDHHSGNSSTESRDFEEGLGGRPEIYSESDRMSYVEYIDNLAYEYRDDDDLFYTEALDYLTDVLSANSYIVRELERRRREDPYADVHTVKQWIEDLLNGEENY